MVQKSIRSIFLILLLASCKVNGNVIQGSINNSDSESHIWDYTIDFKTYDENGNILRDEELNIFGLKFFKFEPQKDEIYVKFLLRSVSNKEDDEFKINNPVFLFLQDSVYKISDLNQKIILYPASPVRVEKKNESILKIISKKYADYYGIFLIDVKTQQDALSFMTSKDNLEIDLSKLNSSELVSVDEIDNIKMDLGVLSYSQPFSKERDYLIKVIAFRRDYTGELRQYTNPPFKLFSF